MCRYASFRRLPLLLTQLRQFEPLAEIAVKQGRCDVAKPAVRAKREGRQYFKGDQLSINGLITRALHSGRKVTLRRQHAICTRDSGCEVSRVRLVQREPLSVQVTENVSKRPRQDRVP